METGGAARAVQDGRLQIIDDDGPRTAAEKLQGMDHAAIELRLALRERELDVHQPAVAEHGDEHRDLAGRVADAYPATLAPIDLHGLSRLVMDFLVDATALGPDGPEIAANRDDTAGIAVGAAAISSWIRTAESSGHLATSASILALWGSK